MKQTKGKKHMGDWYQMRERGAGYWRMEFLWWVYRLFGIRILKFFVGIIAWFIAIFAQEARVASGRYKNILNSYKVKHKMKISKFSAVAHIREFACSVVDKMSAICDSKTPIKFSVNNDADWKKLQKMLVSGQGVFFICSHLGNIEALCAIPDAPNKKMHAFMNLEQSSIFRRFIKQHANYKNTVIHATEDIDVAMAGEIYDAINNGELVMMAGDRKSPTDPNKIIHTKCLDVDCVLPAGVFRFARACDCPVFVISNINVKHEKYRVFVKQINSRNLEEMGAEYMDFLGKLLLQYPKQWFNFFDFFNS